MLLDGPRQAAVTAAAAAAYLTAATAAAAACLADAPHHTAVSAQGP